jgi:hypothetical protein
MSRVPIAFVSFISCLAFAAAHADEFSWELSGLVGESESDPLLEAENSGLQATRFFAPVDDANGPYALASFFDPTSRVSVAWGHERLKISTAVASLPGVPGPSASLELVTKTDDYSVGGRYVLPRSKWYFGGSYTTADIENPDQLGTRIVDASGYGVLIGKYLGSATTLEAAFDSTEHDSESLYTVCIGQLICLAAGTLTMEQRGDHASVSVLHVRRLRSMTYSLSGRIAGSSGDATIHTPSIVLPLPGPPVTVPTRSIGFSLPRLQSYSVAGEIFPTAKLGVRIGYARWDDKTPADDAYDVAATWFVRRDLGIQFIYSKQTADSTTIGIFTDDDFHNAETATVRMIGRL